MKYSFLSFAGLCLIVLMSIAACKKSDNSKNTPPIGTLFSALRSAPQNFTVTAGIAKTIYGADSTMISFYINSFKDANGNIITSGTINIQLIEMYHAGKMICNSATTTTTDGKILRSGGQVYLSAAMNGQRIFANKFRIAFKQSGASSQPMELYYGNSNSDSIVSWTISDITGKGTTASGAAKDTTGAWNYLNYNCPFYVFDSCTNFGFTNCDHNPAFPDRVSHLGVKFSDNSFGVGKNTELFLIFTSLNSVYSMSSNVIDTGHGDLPYRDQPYKLVAIANKDNNFFYYETSGITTDTMNINVDMGSETRGDIISRLSGQ